MWVIEYWRTENWCHVSMQAARYFTTRRSTWGAGWMWHLRLTLQTCNYTSVGSSPRDSITWEWKQKLINGPENLNWGIHSQGLQASNIEEISLPWTEFPVEISYSKGRSIILAYPQIAIFVILCSDSNSRCLHRTCWFGRSNMWDQTDFKDGEGKAYHIN